ncbi:mevalonate kinase Erg12 [Schizosaccharomyces pombe]|uniref:Mevalonate kinase n=1 Tax=Schizosaccharomyces pombe (strain 972 / ATCC 24843) TaxID=284812 RepID=ERG12_SCHPO|nr:putative mevalonate kinase Erg12 [Schizosaccharomyces pombe]Q09780.1 RecName: Full=Mevalonate kinase; Short=MK [Schizosaccharomyces pombe 972h-]BAA25169.1 putative mevalonate kinase [Schizosaccharomyces pombe]CAA91104.1 mevalonate kinase Erg12 (predicted) [Schizosaccharomyces pombe]|eukprot:NP_592837.1 putative mevalonate kinase Erg12 [Schizosaccharomyces pombe]
MSKSLIVSSPGKTILFGEHAVVYGATALAAAVSLRSYCKLQTTNNNEIVIVMSDIGTERRWNLQSLPWQHVTVENVQHPASSPNLDLLQGLGELLKNEENGLIHSAMLCTLYLFTSLSSPSQGCTLTISSQVPLGAGLGSSATISVVVATSLLLAFGNIEPPSSNSLQNNKALALIEAWSFLGECCIHGTPSGIDNAVATNGGLIAFRKATAHQSAMKEFLKPKDTLSVMITDTKQPKSTKKLVQGVFELKERLPTVIDSIIDAIDGISKSAVLALTSESDKNSSAKKLGEFIVLNQKLLECLGVSHYSIDRVLQATKSIGWTKLTGAGGGGCTITLLTPECKEEEFKLCKESLLAHKNSIYDVQLGGPGVSVVTDSDSFFPQYESDFDFKKLNLLSKFNKYYI